MKIEEALREILNTEKYHDSKISKEKLLSVISKDSYNLYELGYSSADGISKFTKRNFPDKPRNSKKLHTFLLEKYGLKYCSKCKEVYEVKYFSSNKTRSGGLNSWCKSCFSNYQKKEPEKWRFYRSTRKAIALQATPKWANLQKIKEIYNNCPNNYQVDHIIPLQNSNVCGLHVENNLQYLTTKENLEKHNKFDPVAQ